METFLGIMIPFLGTTLGAACVFFMKRSLGSLVQRALAGFAAGVMVAASIWSLLIPAIEQSEGMGKLSFLPAFIGFWVGVLFLLLLDHLIPHLHVGSNQAEGPKSRLGRTTMMVLAVTLHNIPEGMAVGVMYAGFLAGNTQITAASALALSLGIAIQNFPEGAIISMPLRAEGESKGRAFLGGVLSGVDLTKTLTKEEYKKEIDRLQKRLEFLHSEIYRLRIPVVLGFEGWDAGGKGGAIKRLTSHLDPRGYRVNPTASPNDIEKVHHYLWRFWNNVPKAGHIAVFDRTWYGRVMVERIEGFCSEADWKRAYQEINEMEAHMANAGAVVIKFWLHIDKDEQERRFKERQQNPAKEWKITDEDWRNREKWDQYETAVNEMLVRTSTTYAPWVVVEGNCKYYARVKVLRTVVDALEERVKACGKK